MMQISQGGGGGGRGYGVLTQECHRTGTEPSNSGELRQLMIYLMVNLQLNWKKKKNSSK